MSLDIRSSGLSDALVILGAAGLVIPAFARLKISPVIGFLIVGFLVGPSMLGAHVSDHPWLYYLTISNPHGMEPFGEFGIVLLLFTIGLELSFARLWDMRKMVFGLGSAELLGCAALIAILLTFVGVPFYGAVGLGLALALSSTALVLPISGTSGAVGRTAFAMLLFEDLALVPIIFALGFLSPKMASGGESLLLLSARGLLTIGALFAAGRMLLPPIFAQAARTKSRELFLSASLLVVIVASLATSAAGLSPIVGALLAGLLIAETDYHESVADLIEPFKNLALGVFLISVGMSIEAGYVLANWPRILAAMAAVLAVKALVTAALLRVARVRRGVAAEIGLMMSSPSELTLIVLSAAVTAGLIDDGDARFWKIVTALGLTVTPFLALLGRRLSRELELHETTPDPGGDLLVAEGAERPVLLLGFGRVGRIVSDMLRRQNVPYVGIDSDVDAVRQARRDGYRVEFGDSMRSRFLETQALATLRAIVLTMDDPVQQSALAKLIRARAPDLPIIARAHDAADAARLYKAGASDAIPETLEGSLQMAEAVLTGIGKAVGPVIAELHDLRAELRQKIVDESNGIADPRLRPGKR